MTALLYLIIALENIVGLFCMGCLLYDIKIGLVEPTPKTCLTYFLKLAMATTATTLLYTKLWSILYSSITARLALEVMGSFVATCVLRHRQASDCFLVIVSQELRGIFNDFSAAPMSCVKAHRLGWRSLIGILYKSASGLPRYALYGPVLGGFRLVEKFFLVPLHLVQKVLHMSSLWCENSSRLPQAVSGLPLTWGGGAIWIGIVGFTSFLSFMLITHLSGTLTHRFFAHRCFCTSRGFTWVLYAFCSLQTPPIWWSSIHRRHHRQTDSDTDPHPPGEKGFLYAYLGWLTDRENFGTNLTELRDMTNSYPELLLLELLPIGIEDMVRRFCVLPLWTATARFVLRMQWGEAPDTIIQFHERFVVQVAYIGAIFAVHVSLFFNAYAHQASDGEKIVSPEDTVCVDSGLIKKQLEETEVRQSGGNVNDMKPQESMEVKKDRKEEVHPTNKRPYAAKDLHIKWFDYISSGESYHARHHKWPRLAQNSPYSREDWVFLFINCMERMGLVWKVVRQNKMKTE